MADLDVQPKSRSKSILAWVLLALGLIALIVFLARGCNDADTYGTTSDTTNTVGNAIDSGVERVSNWWDDVDINAPEIRYDEVTNRDITVRGNERYGIYEIGENILFDVDKSTIKPQAAENLKEIAASIDKRYKNGNIRVYGYTDSVGTATYNKELAAERAEAVKNWLIQTGNITADRITVHPVGQGSPEATNETARGRKQNRRVEILAGAATGT